MNHDASTSVALLGDLVDSRASSDRVALHARLSDALTLANRRHHPLDALRVTVGDEFQGVFGTLGDALAASYTVRLALGDDVRFGIGRGAVSVIDTTGNVQDGSAWWSARAAIDDVKKRARGSHRALRTGLGTAEGMPPAPPTLVAAVELADAMLTGLDAESRAILTLLLHGRPQAQAAEQIGVSRSAVSQRVARNGLAILADSLLRLGEAE
ncbi:MAG: SatD family protein [Propioniciclava sp.]|uniref:SatD family protein n=1 Tax=Propioniciclava sp. TaxID=2038686 RepID=UPI0039E49956